MMRSEPELQPPMPLSRDEYLPRSRVSITFKVWAAIMAIVVVVLVCLWSFLVVFLEDSYVSMKSGEFTRTVQSVIDTVNADGVAASSTAVLELVKGQEGQALCVEVVPDSGLSYKVDAMPYSCFTHNHMDRRREMIAAAVADPAKIHVQQVGDTAKAQEYLVGVGRVNSVTPAYTVILTQTLAPVREAASVVRTQLLYITIALIVLATVVAFLISRSMTRPLTKITKAAKRIAGGELGVTVDVGSNDEIGDLGQNFNLMSKEISKVNTLQRELVANISHDMRTPLTMIRGYAEMIKDITGEDKQAREEQLDIIIDESNRLSNLVTSAMDLSLLQAGQSAMRMQPFDIAAKGRNVLARYRLLEQTEGFCFRLEAPETLFVLGDEVRIEQVLHNLINNAVNHIGAEKRITLRIRPEDPAAAESEIRIEVEDTGTGIPPEELPLIWDRYYKPYKKGQKQQGTGLGLSIVKAVLVNHQSRFGVASTVGVGSTFWFTLRRTEPGQSKPAGA